MATVKEHYAYITPPPPIDYVEVDLEDRYNLDLYVAKTLVETHLAKGVEVRLRNGEWFANVPRGIYFLVNAGEKLQSIVLLRAFAAKVYLDSKNHQ
jgi:hypothetical protein